MTNTARPALMPYRDYTPLSEVEFFSLVEATFPKKWVSSVLIQHEELKIRTPNKSSQTKMHLFTESNEYIITIVGAPIDCATDSKKDESYLGCIAVARKERAGETWRRGNDLTDGPCSKETWQEIINDILAYELIKIHKERKIFKIDVDDLDHSEAVDKIERISKTFETRDIEDVVKSKEKYEDKICKKEMKIAADALYRELGSLPQEMVTVGYTITGELVVYVLTTRNKKIHVNHLETFLGFKVSYQECGNPETFATNA